MPKDFNYALRQNGLGEYARGSRRPVKSRGSVTNRPSYQRQTPLYNQRATMPVYTPQPTPVWGEYAGHSQHKSWSHSPAMFKQLEDFAESALARMEAILDRSYYRSK